MPLEILYADDLIFMAESEESLRDKIVKWKSGLEAKGLKMNTGKTKVMFSCSMKDKAKRKVSGPVVYVRRELAIIQFCAMVARNGFCVALFKMSPSTNQHPVFTGPIISMPLLSPNRVKAL